jgi:CDP-paratose 2-epimerase
MELTQLCSDITGNKIPIASIAENRAADIRIYVTDNTKINAATGWKPKRNMEQLVADTFQWLQANEKDLKNIL